MNTNALDLRTLRRMTAAVYSSATRQYRRERVTLVRRELRRETDEEIRAAVRGLITTAATD